MMPITIQSTLPHIVLQFGPNMDTANCPSICCAVDTCAALMTVNFHFFIAIAKRYLHCIVKILTHANYAPIVLSGIVQNKDEAVTTELEVGFQFQTLNVNLINYPVAISKFQFLQGFRADKLLSFFSAM
jgi:hypothetical protein